MVALKSSERRTAESQPHRGLHWQSAKTTERIDAYLRSNQWIEPVDRLDELDKREVLREPSRYSLAADARR